MENRKRKNSPVELKDDGLEQISGGYIDLSDDTCSTVEAGGEFPDTIRDETMLIIPIV